MTIDEAIEILGQYVRDEGPHDQQGLIDASKLGVEALKRLQGLREQKSFWIKSPLPGETTE